jgi:Na+-transporting NADH:ubiquinone oxidoreductase subunit NqrB
MRSANRGVAPPLKKVITTAYAAQRPGVTRLASGLVWVRSRMPRDARIYQILFLGSLLSLGVLARDFSLNPEQMALTFVAGISTQIAFVHALKLERVGVLSALITCFGLSILLRADSLWVHPLVASSAIASKFLLRFRGKHIYNPANLGVVLALLLLPGAWVSSGQWGNDLVLACWFIALGGIVTCRAQRADISLIFLGAYAALLAARVLWLGQPWAMFFHQLASGALLLFTFFMISDPMTTPNRVSARYAYAMIVAGGAFLCQYWFFKPHGLIWALFIATPLVPLFDRLWPGAKHQWQPHADASSGRAA